MVLSASSVGVLSARLVGVPCRRSVFKALYRKNVEFNLGLVGALSGPCFGLVGVLSVPFAFLGALSGALTEALSWTRLSFKCGRHVGQGPSAAKHLVGPCRWPVLQVLSCRCLVGVFV